MNLRVHPQNPLRPLALIGVAWGGGGPDPGPADGPAALRRLGVGAVPRRADRPAVWLPDLSPGPGPDALGGLLRRLADTVAARLAAGELPVVVGGDHSIAAGTWRGVGRAYGEAPGLLWIDAHLDAHTPASSPSGNPHGMPLAALLGYGDPAMAGVPGPTLDPRRVAVLAARDWEPAEQSLLESLGVRIFDMGAIRRQGLAASLEQALEVIDATGGLFGISLDLDALDPPEAPGVACPSPGGPLAAELLAALRGVARRPGCLAIEIAEYHPGRDVAGQTGRLAGELLAALLAPGAGETQRWEGEAGGWR